MQPNGKINQFEDLIVWQKAMSLCLEIYRISSWGEFGRDWGLRDQIRRASVSIPSNIAEGFERHSAQELRHYLNIAKGSAGEVRTQLALASRLEYISPTEGNKLSQECIYVSRMLAAYRKRVNRTK